MNRICHIILYSIILALGMSLNSCTQYKINIGDWHGSWHLQEIYIDGELDKDYSVKPNIMISFQRNLFNFAYIETLEIYGTWSYAGEILTLNAGYDAGAGAGNEQFFNPFPIVMGFSPGETEVEITVTKLTESAMQWQYIDRFGKLRTYNFKKYP